MTSRQRRRMSTAIAGLPLALPMALKTTARQYRFTGVAMGNALQSLHTFVDPGVRHLMTQTIDETANDDGEGDASDPKKHSEDQMPESSVAKEIERLTILMN